jgi:hypothetical protein
MGSDDGRRLLSNRALFAMGKIYMRVLKIESTGQFYVVIGTVKGRAPGQERRL